MGGMSIGLGDVLRLQAASRNSAAPRARSVIMIFLSGGPSHLDMYDMKPDAPSEYRGEFNPIRTNVPGIEICELMPHQAKIADKFAILRGCQLANLHTGNAFYSGYGWQENPRASVPGEAQRPALGSVVSRIRKTDPAIPPYVSLENPPIGNAVLPRPRARAVPRRLRQPARGSGKYGPAAEGERRAAGRRSELLHAFDLMRRDVDIRRPGAIDVFQHRALEIVTTDKVRDAFDLDREPADMRARYGEGGSPRTEPGA